MSDSAVGRLELLIRRMRQALDGFESGAVALPELVADVGSLIEAMFEVADEDWVERLRSAWSGLEITYAVGLDEARPALSHEDRRFIGAAIAERCSLLAARCSLRASLT